MNFGLGVVDRGKNVSDFIKRDSTEPWATVEVELKNKVGQPNVVIRRHFDAASNTFTIDGQKATGKAVSELVLSLYIQVDNLCVFMPQERVAELANMSPELLLRATEKAAGGQKLHDLHTRLIELKREEVTAAKAVNESQKSLTSREDALSELQREMDKFIERRTIEKTLAVLNIHLPWARYRVAKEHYEDLKEVKADLKDQLARAQAADRPYQEMVQSRVDKLEKARKTASGRHGELQVKLTESTAALAKHESATDAQKAEMNNIRAEEEQRLKAISEGEKAVTRHEEKIAELAPGEEPDREAINRLNREKRRLSDEMAAVQAEQREADLTMQQARHEIEQAQFRIGQAESVRNMRNAALSKERGGTDILKAVAWINKNRERLRGHVYDPIQLSVGCRDTGFARQLEACVNQATMRTILCEHEEDYHTLSRELSQQYRINVATLTHLHALDQHPPPFDRAELQRLGFQCFALDQVDAPDAVKGYLCKVSNLHRIPITRDPAANIDVDRLEQANSGIRRYMTAETRVTIGYARLGTQDKFVSTSTLPPSHVFKVSVDQRLVQEQRHRMAEAQTQHDAAETALEALQARDSEIRAAHQVVAANHAELKAALDAHAAANRAVKGLQTKLAAAKNTLAKRKAEEPASRRRASCKAKLQKLATEHVKLATAHKDILMRLGDSLTKGTAALFELAQAATDLRALEGVVAERSERHADAKKAFDQARAEQANAKKEAEAIHDQALEIQHAMTPDVLADFQVQLPEMRKLALEEIERRAAQAERELAAAPSVSAGVEDSLKKLQKQIGAIKGDLDTRSGALDKLQRKLGRLQDKYDPAIEQLVSRISENFSKCFGEMRLLGEVQVDRNDADYAQWGIKIMVSFREGDDMQRLTAKHQSGGERALSTVVYFMSLMRQAKTPFTVVDEINQGMDQKNERAMHDHLVRVTCASDAGQTFLVTPKLLTGLTYSDKMRVLCIGNGPWLPDDGFDMLDLLRRHKKRRLD